MFECIYCINKVDTPKTLCEPCYAKIKDIGEKRRLKEQITYVPTIRRTKEFWMPYYQMAKEMGY